MLIRFNSTNKTTLQVFLLILMLPCIVIAQKPKLILGSHPLAWGSSCAPGMKLITGSRFFLRINNTVDTLALPLAPGWPEGYTLEAALDLPDNAPFIPTSGLIEQMEPTRILSQLNRGAYKGLQKNPTAFHDYENLNAKDFVITVPSDLAGHTVNFRARYEGKSISLISESTGPIRIVSPCNRSDTARIVATRIYETWEIGDYPRIIELADSMMACSLSDAAAWDNAVSVAEAMNLHDKAMLYWARSYEDFGEIGDTRFMDQPPQINREGARDPRKMQRVREIYEKMKAEKQQQQNQH